MTDYNLIDTTSATAQQFEQLFRERRAYRDALIVLVEELREEVMPKMQAIHTRLNGGTDRERNEGHKLWLLHNHLTFVCDSLVEKEQE